MTEERFLAILLDEGMTPLAARKLWETRPLWLTPYLVETLVRWSAQQTMIEHPETRAIKK